MNHFVPRNCWPRVCRWHPCWRSTSDWWLNLWSIRSMDAEETSKVSTGQLLNRPLVLLFPINGLVLLDKNAKWCSADAGHQEHIIVAKQFASSGSLSWVVSLTTSATVAPPVIQTWLQTHTKIIPARPQPVCSWDSEWKGGKDYRAWGSFKVVSGRRDTKPDLCRGSCARSPWQVLCARFLCSGVCNRCL